MLAVPAIAATLALDDLYRRHRPDQPSKAFEFLAINTALVVALAFWRTLSRRRILSAGLIPIAAMIAVLSTATTAVLGASVPSWDYRCYEAAAQLLRAGANPYPSTGCYIYPPLLAAALAWSAAALERVFGAAAAWPSTFILFQAGQVVAVGAAFVLLVRAARSGVASSTAAIMVAALLIVNVPLLDTIANDQINVMVLALACAAVAAGDGAGWIAGACIAIGTALKLYPIALVPVFWAAGRRRAAAASVVWMAVALLAVGQPRSWIDFASRLASRPAGFPSLSDNSMFSLVANGARLVSGSPTTSPPPAWVGVVWAAWAVAVAAYGVVRLLRRERERRVSDHDGLLFAQMADVLALSLVASPLAWPHHYVLALPATVAAAVSADDRRRLLVGAGALLMFAVPIFHVWLLSDHRLLGLGLVLFASRPIRHNRGEFSVRMRREVPRS